MTTVLAAHPWLGPFGTPKTLEYRMNAISKVEC